ncbi:MAG: hypothetical protein V4577_29945 [Bacteroidota bacterium]
MTLDVDFTTTQSFTASIQAYDCLSLTTRPTLNPNYIITNTPRIAGLTDEN